MNTPDTANEALYDVVAVNIFDSTISMMGEGHAMRDAKAIMKMAIIRRGVDEHFYSVVRAGMYKDGDKWCGDGIDEGSEG